MAYKALDVARYIINYSNEKNYGVSNLKLQKLLYFVQAYFLICNNGESCFDDKIEAWDFGPVVPEAYHEFKQFGANDIPTVREYMESTNDDIWTVKTVIYNEKTIKENDRKMIEAVVDKFADYSATDLVKITHHQDPWKIAYTPGFNNVIESKSIREYFNG